MQLTQKRNYGKGIYKYNYIYLNKDKLLEVLDDNVKLREYIYSILFKKENILKEKENNVNG